MLMEAGWQDKNLKNNKMEIRFQNSFNEVKQMSTEELRKNFLIEQLMVNDELQLIYSHYDRMIVAGAVPVFKKLELPNHPELQAKYFLERREMGIFNVGGKGKVTADDIVYDLEKMDCVYLGKGTKQVFFSSENTNQPAIFYMLSSPAHMHFPNTKYTKEQAFTADLGDVATSNKRTIRRYIHADGIQSCQLVMGLTILETGSVWNTMPAHTHTRRMEVYFYFDVPDGQRIIHLMGQPQETRHLIMNNNEAVISAPWSVHAGCGTSNYGFIWGMCGENLDYGDMDMAPIEEMR